MKTKAITFFAAALAGSMLTGCTRDTVSSQNIRTEGIVALVDVTATTEKDSIVHAELRVGGPGGTYVILDSGDSLTATAGTESKAMQSTDEGEYEAKFTTAAAGTEFTMALDRKVDTDAPMSRGVMPAPFEITGVPAASTSRTGDDITITWGPTEAGSDVTISVNGSCIFGKDFDVAGDPGTFTIAKGTLDSTSESMPQSCDVSVTMKRTAKGTPDPVFDSQSTFTLAHVRESKFTSAP